MEKNIDGPSDLENPIDFLESFFSSQNWSFFRHSEYEIGIEAQGNWCERHINFIWQRQQHSLYFTCRLQSPITEDRRRDLDSLLVRINGSLWMGHFELCPQSGCPTFRHCLPLRGIERIGSGVIEDLLDVGLSECDRFYPAFQLVLWGNYDSHTALQSVLLECRGEA